MGQVYQFGAFRVDPVRRVLLREGEPVPITPKAFSILLLLIESRNRTVAKDELIQGAWSGAHVSDANLMQNISSLRKALGERAGDGRYIVTIPGQGYRFAGDLVEVVDEEAAVPSAPLPLSPPPAAASIQEDPAPVPSASPAPQPPALQEGAGRPRRVPLLIALGAVLLLLGAGALVLKQRSQERTSRGAPDSGTASRPDIAILGLRNLSGDPRSDGLGPALTGMLAAELAAGDQVRVIPGEEVERARLSMGDLPPQSLGSLDAASLQKLHGLLGADLVVEGAYLALSGGRAGEGARAATARVRLDLRVLSAPGGEVVASVAEVGAEDDLEGLVARAGSRLRSLLGLAELT